jgi:peptide-methionine (S)-S-oxide reductase
MSGARILDPMKKSMIVLAVFILAAACISQSVSSAGHSEGSPHAGIEPGNKGMAASREKVAFRLATFGAGCFWCVEAIFEELDGVEKVVSGYSGGHASNPSYEEVCSGRTGHAEVVQITYDPKRISYDELLEIYWRTHDPTTRNRQGNDVGTQYRSVVLYHDEEQKKLAEGYKARLEAEHIWDRPIVTEIVRFERFWPAEAYHQDYYRQNPGEGYCSLVITPKIEKLRKIFKDKLKPK